MSIYIPIPPGHPGTLPMFVDTTPLLLTEATRTSYSRAIAEPSSLSHQEHRNKRTKLSTNEIPGGFRRDAFLYVDEEALRSRETARPYLWLAEPEPVSKCQSVAEEQRAPDTETKPQLEHHTGAEIGTGTETTAVPPLKVDIKHIAPTLCARLTQRDLQGDARRNLGTQLAALRGDGRVSKVGKARRRRDLAAAVSALGADGGGAVLIERYRAEILELMYNRAWPAREFITHLTLNNYWTEEKLRAATTAVGLVLVESQIQEVKDHLLRTLSILVLIGWDNWARFPDLFLRGENSLLGSKDDAVMELTHAKLEAGLGSNSSAWAFASSVCAFTPVVIEFRKMKQLELNSGSRGGFRLPFLVDQVLKLGSGAGGTVFRETIAPGGFRDEDGHLNPTASGPFSGSGKKPVKVVARKCFNSKNAFHKEQANLDLLLKSLLKHEHIVIPLAMINIEMDLSILMSVQDCNLDTFLHKPGRLREQTSLCALLHQVECLADALFHLHEPNHSGQRIYHMDLTPNNILIQRPSSPEGGRWMLTDFGLSSRVHSPNPKSKLGYTDVRSEVVPWCNARTGYTPPEAPEYSGRSDVWSLGCIFSLVVCRRLYGVKGLEEYNAARSLHPSTNDYFYDDRKLKPVVLALQECLRASPSVVVQQCGHLLKWMQNFDQEDRPRAHEVREELARIRALPEIDPGLASIESQEADSLRALPFLRRFLFPPPEQEQSRQLDSNRDPRQPSLPASVEQMVQQEEPLASPPPPETGNAAQQTEVQALPQELPASPPPAEARNPEQEPEVQVLQQEDILASPPPAETGNAEQEPDVPNHDLYIAINQANEAEGLLRLVEQFATNRTTPTDLQKHYEGLTALCHAARAGRPRIAKYLLDRGAAVDATDQHQNTPLMHACKAGNCDVAELLLRHRADWNRRGQEGYTCLHLAIHARRMNILMLFKQMEPVVAALPGPALDANQVNNSRNKTPLELVLLWKRQRQRHEYMRVLLDLGATADVYSPNDNHVTVVDLVLGIDDCEAMRILLDALPTLRVSESTKKPKGDMKKVLEKAGRLT
ncbi:hypothetical protein BJY00DRAFT_308937 [Aspergillus carlsbadensis]|nr:hypothetical protein BJY00DRAFT_308937 [Aspergillus carlsbadensis]